MAGLGLFGPFGAGVVDGVVPSDLAADRPWLGRAGRQFRSPVRRQLLQGYHDPALGYLLRSTLAHAPRPSRPRQRHATPQ